MTHKIIAFIIIGLLLITSSVFAQINFDVNKLRGASTDELLQIKEELRKTNLKSTNATNWGYTPDYTQVDGRKIFQGTLDTNMDSLFVLDIDGALQPSTGSGAGLFELDGNDDLQPVAGTTTDNLFDLDINDDIQPKEI